MAFYHIPLNEYMYLWNYGKTTGIKDYWVACSKYNWGFFDEMAK